MKAPIAAALVAVPLMLAPPAAADDFVGLTANFAPNTFGINVTVNSLQNYNQQCDYRADPERPSLLQSVRRNFSLTPNGSASLTMPGVPTGTLWSVHIHCDPVPKDAGGFSFINTSVQY